MKLSVYDRMNLPQILPQRANIETQLQCIEIEKKLMLSPLEQSLVNLSINQETGVMTWDPLKEFDKEIEFTDNEINTIKILIDKLDKSEAIARNPHFIAMLIKIREA